MKEEVRGGFKTQRGLQSSGVRESWVIVGFSFGTALCYCGLMVLLDWVAR
jgi:hypothetical protein